MTNRTVTELFPRGCSVEHLGAEALAQILRDSQTLITVNLDINSIGDTGTVNIAAALKVNSAMIVLNLESIIINLCRIIRS